MELYALCDQETLTRKEINLSTFVDLCKKHNASVVQYRDKSSDMTEIKKNLIKLRNSYSGYIIINDIIELVPFCDGIHLGQEDLKEIDSNISNAVKKVRELIGDDKLLGISTHNKEEIEIANTLPLNYIGLGAYRTTITKDVSTVLGDSLDDLAALSKHDVAAIGGVDFDDTFKNVKYRVMGTALYEG
ncbi:MAG: thiamine phosphate synthase [Campylobacterota bacterium]|nr:thiamine phosphate synthase [Campylobacterota bacterium]